MALLVTPKAPVAIKRWWDGRPVRLAESGIRFPRWTCPILKSFAIIDDGGGRRVKIIALLDVRSAPGLAARTAMNALKEEPHNPRL